MATTDSKTALQQHFSRSFNSTVGTGVTTYLPLGVTDREVRFLDLGIVAAQSVVSGHPATNHFVANLYNETDATILATSTISGTTSGSAMERMKFVSIATQSEFIGPGAQASPNKVLALQIVGTNSLNRGIVNPHVRLVADIVR